VTQPPRRPTRHQAIALLVLAGAILAGIAWYTIAQRQWLNLIQEIALLTFVPFGVWMTHFRKRR
jgi:hypothetical protein